MTKRARVASLAVALGLLLAVTLLVAVLQSPTMPWHRFTVSDLRALPEAHLVYPGSILLTEGTQDEVWQGFDPPQEAYILQYWQFVGSPADVTAWFSTRIDSNGWLLQPKYLVAQQSIWSKGRYRILLAVCGDGGDKYFVNPCGNRFELEIFAS